MADMVPTRNSLPPALAELAERTHFYAGESRAALTKRAYHFAWAGFTDWAERHALPTLPASASTVALYVTELADAGQRVSTIQKKLAAISVAHQTSNLETPTRSALVRTTMAGIRRTLGVAQVGKEPILTADIRAMLAVLPDTLLGKRDRALLLMGFSTACRRRELTAIQVADLSFTQEGVIVTIRRSKTDQLGEGRKIGVPFGSHVETCPVRSLQAWLQAAAITEGPIWRPLNRHGQVLPQQLSDEAVAVIVKRNAKRIGLDPRRFGGHSLRSGFCTQAAASASERSIQAVTGHRGILMLRRYIKNANLFGADNAARYLGL